MRTLLLLLMIITGGIFAQEYTLVKDGKPNAVIVIPENPVKAVRFAAAELNAHIKLITGTELPVASGEASEALQIHLGGRKDFKPLEYEVVFEPNRISLSGCDREDYSKFNYTRMVDGVEIYDYRTWPRLFDERGTANAVYDFLEKELGIRWFDQTEFGTDYVPAQTLKVKASPNRRQMPVFEDLQAYAFGHRSVSLWGEKSKFFNEWEQAAYPELYRQFPEFAKRQRLGYNPRFILLAYRHRMGGKLMGINHSLYGYYKRFLDTHPEYFAQGYPDLKQPPQMCYSNPGLINQVVEDAKEWFGGTNAATGKKMDPNRTDIDFDHFAVCPMDNSRYCRCPDCNGKVRNEKEPHFANGVASDYIWTFVNKIAGEIKKELPGKLVSALSYAGYAERPEFPIEDNIDVRVCMHIREAYDHARMENDYKNMRDWSRDRRVWTWVYFGPHSWRENSQKTWKENNYHLFPAFFAHSLDKTLKLYHQQKVRGIFIEGLGYQVEAYVGMTLFHDPTRNVDDILKEYFTRMYGPAGEALLRFYNKVEAAYSNPNNFIKDGNTETIYWGFRGSEANMKSFAEEIATAEKAIANASAIQKQRFENFKLSTWNYMLEGKRRFAAKYQTRPPVPTAICPASVGELPKGDIGKVDWADAMVTFNFNALSREGTMRRCLVSLKHDGEYLYVRFQERFLNKKPQKGDGIRIMIFNPVTKTKKEFFIDHTGQANNVRTTMDYSGGTWLVNAAIPVKSFAPDGISYNLNYRFNLMRKAASGVDEPCLAWGTFDNEKKMMILKFENPASIPSPAPVSSDGLIGDWDFSGSGLEIKDRSPLGNHGVMVNGPKRVTSPFGMALEMRRGVLGDQYVEIENAKGYERLQNYSVAAWIKLEPVWPGAKLVYPCIISGEGGLQSLAIVPRYLNTKIKNNEGKIQYSWGSRRYVAYDKWQFVTMVYDGKKIRIFVNGREDNARVASKEQENLVWDNEGKKLRLGQSFPRHTSYWFRGLLGEVKVFNRALSPEEVYAYYLDGLAKVKNYKQTK